MKEYKVGQRVVFSTNKQSEELATVIPMDPKFPSMDNGTLVHIQPDNSISFYIGSCHLIPVVQ